MHSPNLAHLEAAAEALDPILEQLVFVGGMVAGLLVDDPAARPSRPTVDVDVVAEILGTPGYHWVNKTMRDLGFQPDTREGAPICRWVKGAVVVDIMGTEEIGTGATSRWYADGFRDRIPHSLPSGRRIHILSPQIFLLTKWEAFKSRGKGDYLQSRDIEDMLDVMVGCRALRAGDGLIPEGVRLGCKEMAIALLEDRQFRDECLESLPEGKEIAIIVLEQLGGRIVEPPRRGGASRLLDAIRRDREDLEDQSRRRTHLQILSAARLADFYQEVRSLFGEDPVKEAISIQEKQKAKISGPWGGGYELPPLAIRMPRSREIDILPQALGEDRLGLELRVRGGVNNQGFNLVCRDLEVRPTWSFQIPKTGGSFDVRAWSLEEFQDLLHERLFGGKPDDGR